MPISPDIYYIQVRDKETGAEFPIPTGRFSTDLFTRLDEPAVDPQTGAELPMKPKTSARREATKKTATTSGQKAAPSKEKS